MPQVDLGFGGDGRVSCETTLPNTDPKPDPNVPPESIIHSSVDAWLDHAAAAAAAVVYERDDSAKETTNPKSNANGNSNLKNSRSNSQRRNTNLKAEGPIIGLPARIRHVSCSVSRRRRQQVSTSSRIFPKKSRSKGKPLPESDPTSPKVSCIGKVLSDRERLQKSATASKGFWAMMTAMFICGGGGGGCRIKAIKSEETADVAAGKSHYQEENGTAAAAAAAAAAAVVPTGLGGMKRFSSGRRPASCGGEGDVDSESDRERVFLGRRSVGTVEEGRMD